MSNNTLLQNFLATIEEKFSTDRSSMSMSDWVCANTHLRKKSFSFKGFEFQKRIIDDMHPSLCCIKISQVGLTESQFRKFFGFLRRNTGTTGIFTLPTDIMRDRVSQTRVKPMIDNDEVFNPPGVEKPVRQKGLYQIEQSFGYMTGSTEGDATSISADVLFHDEIDLTDQSMIALFQSRLQASAFKITQSFSTPTYVGYGIDALYAASDQHEYLYRCPHCNHQQIPIFSPKFVHLHDFKGDIEDLTSLSQEQINSIDASQSYWRCEQCLKPLDLTEPDYREWVPAFPGRLTRGYRVRPTTVATIDIPYVLRQLSNYSRLDNLKGFKNTVLGEPDNDSNARLTEAEIRTAMGSPEMPEVPAYAPCFFGADVGLTCHVTLATQGTTILMRQVPNTELEEFVRNLLKRYNIVAGAIDRYPDTTLSEKIKSISDGRILPVHYMTAPGAPSIKEVFDLDESISHWNASRTRAIDEVVKVIRNRTLQLQGYGHLSHLVVEHLRGMIRIELPDTPPKWEKLSNGQDHLLHSLTYLVLAMKAVETNFINRGQDLRSHCSLLGVRASNSGGLQPSDLNRVTGADPILPWRF